MNRQMLSLLAHSHHPVAAPLDDESVSRLLRRAMGHERGRDGTRLLDLGCGGAEWLLRALEEDPDATAEGVDTSAEALERAREKADAAAVGERLVLHEGDAGDFVSDHLFDVVLGVGSAHAFGGLSGALDSALRHLAPGGRVLVGDAYWEGGPSPQARELLGEYEDLATTVEGVAAAGWTPVYGHTSTRQELDDYEWNWAGSLASWALDRPGHPDSAQALAAASEHRTQWLRDYRDSFGFLSLVLRRTHG